MTKTECDYGPSVQTAYEYTYTGDGIRHLKKDYLATKEYRYGCSIDCGGTPLRVYSRELGSQGSWNSVEDYLQVGNALGYDQNWQFEHSGGELLMMGASGEPRAYYPQDSNGLRVQSEPSAPCVCAVQPQTPAVCAPLGYGSCEGNQGDDGCSGTPPFATDYLDNVHNLIDEGDTCRDRACVEPMRFGRRSSWWQRWWCHNVICRRQGGMRSCTRVFSCRLFSVIICVCRRPNPPDRE